MDEKRRLSKQQFIDRTLVRWQARPDAKFRVAARDAELVGFVYEELWLENYGTAFPDAEERPNPNVVGRTHRPTSDGRPRADERDAWPGE